MRQRSPASPTRKKGRLYEALALRHLRGQGLKLITRNYHCRNGEIDLILRDGDTIVFAEVRYRENSSHGSALETVHFEKRRKLIRAAQHYLLVSGLTGAYPIRFDVIGMSGPEHRPRCQWVRDAFRL